MNYTLTDSNPYTQKALPDGIQGLVIQERWIDQYKDLIESKNIQALFLNHSRGWSCESYSFLKELKGIKVLDIIDGHGTGLSSVSELSLLKELGLNCHFTETIDFAVLDNLEGCFLAWHEKRADILKCRNLKRLYISDYKPKKSYSFEALSNLEELTIGAYSGKDLSFLAGLNPDLKVLELLDCRNLIDLSYLGNLVHLKRLRIDPCMKVTKLDFVSALLHLEELILYIGVIDSIQGIEKLQKLKALALTGTKSNIADGNLEPLDLLPQLALLWLNPKKHYSHKVIRSPDWEEVNTPGNVLEKK